MIRDYEFIKYVINYYGNMPKLLDKLGKNVQTNGQVFCPFHYNINTPAAKIYRDTKGWRLYCFNEHRLYGSFDIYKNILNINVRELFNRTWEKLTEEQKKELLDSYGEVEEDGVNIPNLDLYNMFRFRKISYSKLCSLIGERSIERNI